MAKKNANLHPPETWSPNPVPSPPPEITLGLGKVATKRSCSFHQNNKLHYGMNPFLRFASILEGTFSKLLNWCLVPVKLSKQMQEEATSSVQKTPRNLENDTIHGPHHQPNGLVPMSSASAFALHNSILQNGRIGTWSFYQMHHVLSLCCTV